MAVHTIRFTDRQLAFFSRLSWDINPAHCDTAYARRTPFGERLFHGAAFVLIALGAWSEGRRFRMARLVARFTRPIFLDRAYELHVEENGGRVELRLLKHADLRAAVDLEWWPWEDAALGAESPGSFEPLSTPLVVEPETLVAGPIRGGSYRSDSTQLASLESMLGLSAEQLPRIQLDAICWASYRIGMECPGRQALFLAFEMDFEHAADEPTSFRWTESRQSVHRKFQRITQTGKATGVAHFKLEAQFRPIATDHAVSQVEARTGRSQRLAGRTALITGSSRGFGAVLAKAFALHGARVAVHCHSQTDAAEAVRQELASLQKDVPLFQADLACEADCIRMHHELAEQVGSIDLLVLNSMGPIHAVNFADQDALEFDRFVADSLAIVSLTYRHFLPLLSRPGDAFLVSSSYVVTPVAQFSHYIAAKSAAEGLTRALAAEVDDVRFTIFRAPKMRTDQTDSSFSIVQMSSPIEIAAQVLEAVFAGRLGSDVDLLAEKR
jgi:NAD(P)-dependent dehydrogenase (short-subunit alcohol dehydrogenase family)